jgi:hypothetical protein
MADKYKIVRCFLNRPARAVRGMSGLTLEEAQAHCGSPQTTSKTCTTSAGKRLTRLYGPWFDSYERM